MYNLSKGVNRFCLSKPGKEWGKRAMGNVSNEGRKSFLRWSGSTGTLNVASSIHGSSVVVSLPEQDVSP